MDSDGKSTLVVEEKRSLLRTEKGTWGRNLELKDSKCKGTLTCRKKGEKSREISARNINF